MVTREGGAQPQEYLAKYTADRVRTVAITWLGSTMGCAECHDHKFDPFTARDFYQMGAFFADVEQWGVYMDYAYSPNPDLRGYSNDHPFPPEIDVASPALARRIQTLDQQIGQTLPPPQAGRRDSRGGRPPSPPGPNPPGLPPGPPRRLGDPVDRRSTPPPKSCPGRGLDWRETSS